MASWYSFTDYIRNHYTIGEERQGLLKLIFNVGDMRSQVVFINRQVLMDGAEEWVHIESPFGKLADIDVREVLAEMGSMVCGGLSAVGDFITVRHAVPLANLDVNEFERPLALVTSTADALERKYVGGDSY